MERLADAPNVADWIAAVGQAVGALATAAAVVVALWIALRESKERARAQEDAAEAERLQAEQKSLGQARLVNGDLVQPEESSTGSQGFFELSLKVSNHSASAIRNLRASIRYHLEDGPINVVQQPSATVLGVGESQDVVFRDVPTANLDGWRVMWRDSDEILYSLTYMGTGGRVVSRGANNDYFMELSPKSEIDWFKQIITASRPLDFGDD